MRAVLTLFLLILPTAAFAHTGLGDTSGVLHGLAHPFGGLDHMLAMLAVGVFAHVLGGRAFWLVPLSFMAMMVFGFLVGVSGLELPFVELAIALSSLVIGAAAASGKPMKLAGAMALVGVFAVFHGLAHGAEMPAGAADLDYGLGFVVATGLLHAAGIALAAGLSRLAGKYGQFLARAAGGIFALGGAGLLAGWL